MIKVCKSLYENLLAVECESTGSSTWSVKENASGYFCAYSGNLLQLESKQG